MANIKKDLWGELDFLENQVTPLAILREQASLLDKKSSNRLRGDVSSKAYTPYESKEERIAHRLYVVVPGLKNRRQELLRVVHEIHEIFPVHLIDGQGENQEVYKLDNIEEFEKKLSETLSGSRIKEILEKLYNELNNRAVAA